MKILIYSFSIVILTLMLGCERCLNKKGVVQTYSHPMQPFNELDIEGKFNITLIQSTNSRVTFEGHQGIIDLL
ncbi:DUF2807 domain-containing protein, partial [Salibacteraceae bacterium]|nr:DUF2807 domain-containing protein [Salibacteraceae bacterium]